MPRAVSKAKVLRLQRKYAKRFGVDSKYLPYLAAQIEQESGFRTNLGSRAGAQDVAQFMPGTAPGFGVTLGDNKIEDDIRGQVKMMSGLIRRQGNINDALRGYNAGEGAIGRSHGFAETNQYVQIVNSLAKKYQGQADAETGGPAAAEEGTAGTPDRTVQLPGNPDVELKTGGKMDPAGLMSVLERLGRKDYDSLDFATDYRDLQQDAAASEKTLTLAGTPGTQVTIPGTPGTPGRGGPNGRGYPLASKGKIIGTPHSGTHTLGNWQSDNALDISTPNGTPVLATGGGKVVKVSGSYQGGASRFDGYQVTIQGPGGGVFYTHLSKANVKPGDTVSAGDVLGKSGSANGVPHLHIGFEKGNPEARIRPRAGSGGPKADTSSSGAANFEGKQVAGWIAPALEYARKKGWTGSVNEGVRSVATQTRYYNEFIAGKRNGPVAKPGTSHHQKTDWPHGAIDVDGAEQLSRILRNSPWRNKLVWAGAKDPPHFSKPHGGSY